MSALVCGPDCEPGGRDLGMGLGITPEPTHKCSGGESMPGVLGGWSCPCACHRAATDPGSGT